MKLTTSENPILSKLDSLADLALISNGVLLVAPDVMLALINIGLVAVDPRHADLNVRYKGAKIRSAPALEPGMVMHVTEAQAVAASSGPRVVPQIEHSREWALKFLAKGGPNPVGSFGTSGPGTISYQGAEARPDPPPPTPPPQPCRRTRRRYIDV